MQSKLIKKIYSIVDPIFCQKSTFCCLLVMTVLQKCGHTNQGIEIIKPIILYKPTSIVDCLFVRIFILLISANIL